VYEHMLPDRKSGRSYRSGLSFDDGHDVFLAHHEQFFAVDLDGLPGVLAEQNAVADLD
jgi:hypothetical protein